MVRSHTLIYHMIVLLRVRAEETICVVSAGNHALYDVVLNVDLVNDSAVSAGESIELLTEKLHS